MKAESTREKWEAFHASIRQGNSLDDALATVGWDTSFIPDGTCVGYLGDLVEGSPARSSLDFPKNLSSHASMSRAGAAVAIAADGYPLSAE
jgi:hypothetical protein